MSSSMEGEAIPNNSVSNIISEKIGENGSHELTSSQNNTEVIEVLEDVHLKNLVACDKTKLNGEKNEGITESKTGTNLRKLRKMYSVTELRAIRHHPASRKWPDFLDVTYRKPDKTFDLERWFHERGTTGEKKTVNGSASAPQLSTLNNERPPDLELRKSKDPRERIKQEEQDGIVLSPQRRSFGTGCRVIGQGSASFVSGSRPDSPADRPSRESHREIPARRIGSGRLVRRDDNDQTISDRRDMNRKDSERDSDQRRDHRDWRIKNDNRYIRERDDRHHDKRKRFFEEEERRIDRRDTRDRRYDHRRESQDREEETPEWFTGGPSSQNECIELVGFDEEETVKPKRERRRSKKDREGGSQRSSRCNTPVIIEQEEPQEDDEIETVKNIDQEKTLFGNPVVVEPTNDQDSMQFNIEDYLADILNIGSEDASVVEGASRLKQFFKRESPVLQGSAPNSRRSSIDLCPQISNMLGFTEPVIRIPSPNQGLDSPHFFAPISPANGVSQNSVVDMLQQAKARQMQTQVNTNIQPPTVKSLLIGGKSLEEIEAGLRKHPQVSPGSKIISVPPPLSLTKNMIPPPSGPHMSNTLPPTSANNQVSHFNDFLSQVSAPQKMMLDGQRHGENVLTKLLNGSIKNDSVKPSTVNRQPIVPNNAHAENDLISMLMRKSEMPGSMNQMSGSSNARASLPNHISNNILSGGSSTMPLPAACRTHLAPPSNAQTSQQDIIMKILQKQQIQQLQQQKQNIFHSQQHQQDPIKKLIGGGVSNLGISSSASHPDHSIRETLMRSDLQTLFQRLINGQVSESQLMTLLANGNLNAQQRETIATALKLIHSNQTSLAPPRGPLTPSPTPQPVMGGMGLGTTPASLSPRVASPNPDASNMLAPHMMPQARVSPLMFAPGAAPRRVLSHQELVVHTQSIMQNALLKQGLEKAREKHRKREAERTRSPNPSASMNNGPSAIHSSNANRIVQSGSPTKLGLKRQSPLAFTPTSVMRKMTAERDRNEKEKNMVHSSEGNGIEGDKMRDHPITSSSAKMTASMPPSYQAATLKADVHRRGGDIRRSHSPLPSVTFGPKAPMVIGGHNPPMMSMTAPTPPPHPLVPTSHHRHNIPLQTSHPIVRPNQHNLNNFRALQNQATQSALAHHMIRGQGQTTTMHTPHMGGMHPRMQSSKMSNFHNPTHQQLSVAAGNHSNNINNNVLLKTGDHALHVPSVTSAAASHRNSPVNLMNFFGRDLMAQVQAGSLPELPGGKVLSLEEVERLQQTQAVRN